MKAKKYTNSFWIEGDYEKEYSTATDTYTTLPATFQTSGADVENYQVYGASSGVGEETESDEPAGYKIPISNTSGVTENLWGFTTQPLSGNGYLYNGSINLPAGTYTLRADLISSNVRMSFAVVDNQGNTVYNASITNHGSATFTSNYNMTQLRFYVSNTVDELYLTLIEGSTPPDHYIPHRYESNYDLFIGDSKLYEDEYVDFVEQKMYKYVSGVLTPTDPPLPFPAISTYIGENNLSVDTTVQPEKVVVTVAAWREIEAKKYQNEEWSDNNGT